MDLDEVPWVEEIDPDSWYRLVPIAAPEQALLASDVIKQTTDGVAPGVYSIDMKRVMPADVIKERGDLFLSERLAHALLRAGGSGWSASWEPHVTANPVAGYRILRVTSAGWLGTIDPAHPAETFAFTPPPPTERSFRRIPLTPVAIDASNWSGDTVCWSPWLGIGRGDFRMLLVRGGVLRAVLDRLPDLCCGVEPIVARTSGGDRGDAASPLGERPADPPEARLEHAVARLAEGTAQFAHRFYPRGTNEEIEWVVGHAPFALPPDYLELLRVCNGVDAFRLDFRAKEPTPGDERAGALRLWRVGARGELARRQEESRDFGYTAWTDDWFPIGEAVEEDIIWMVDAFGRVRGAGKEGVQYGPDAPFTRWLADQVADLADAWSAFVIADEQWARSIYGGMV